MEFAFNVEVLVGLVTLILFEIVLGIDNLVFLSIIADRLPEKQRPLARRLGLGLALASRVVLLFFVSWIIGLTAPLFTAFEHTISWRDLILIGGGLFLLAKATYEIHNRVEGEDAHGGGAGSAGFTLIVLQIAVLDVVFSIDSVITAVGMVRELWVMITAVMIAMGVMIIAVDLVSNFINRHPTVKMLALGFLLLIGTALVGEGLHFEVPKGYIYFAMAFASLIEGLNILVARRRRARAAR